MLSDLDAANAEANRLAEQLEDTSLDAQELAAAADELLSIADAELEASRADRDRLQAEVVDAREEHSQLLILVEHLEAALESAAAALSEREQRRQPSPRSPPHGGRNSMQSALTAE